MTWDVSGAWGGEQSTDSTEAVRACAALSRVAEPGDKTVARLVATVGAIETWHRIRSGLDGLGRFRARVESLDVDRLMHIAEQIGARIVIPGDHEWPTQLDQLPVPPWCLWVRGPLDLQETSERSVALVGSRACTAYGEHVAADLSAGLASRGWTVVSGAAMGIDAAAHRGALAMEGHTFAFLAGGVERAYPPSSSGLLARIAHDGAVISEVAPGSAAYKTRFLQRNRLIAAISRGTVMVEADLRSGSRNTVRHAAELARPIGAVPGPTTSMQSSGCHREIRDGRATLVTSVDDVIELVGRIGDDLAAPVSGLVLPTDGLEPDEALVHEALPVRAVTGVERLSRATGLSDGRVRALLGRLESAGLATSAEGGWRKARPPRPTDLDPSPYSLVSEQEKQRRAARALAARADVPGPFGC